MNNIQPERPADRPVPGYIALTVPPEVQARLKEVAEPRYPLFKGEHITLLLGAKQPSPETDGQLDKFRNAAVNVYGVADDGLAVQCFLVTVNGEKADPKGRLYHLTWSLDPDVEVPADYNKNGKPGNAKPMHAAHVAAIDSFVTILEKPIPLQLSAAFYPEQNSAPAPAALPAPAAS